MLNSRAKGARFERSLAAWFRENLGTPARRGQQYSGTEDSPDIRDAIPGVHIEAKHVNRLNLYEAMDQAAGDCGSLIPVVVSKADRKPILVTVRLDDFLSLSTLVAMTIER